MSLQRLILAGAPLDTGNRGVEALGRSVLDAIDASASGIADPWQVTVLDNGWGIRPQAQSPWQHALVTFAGARRTRRVHRPESWTQIAAALRLRGRLNPVARAFVESRAVLDISGGDSFTDLYGATRLATVSAPKRAALRARRPLVLLPQTFGPFTTGPGRQLAESLVRASALAYSRDELSHERLLDLAGPNADHSRCRRGVDVAFALQPREPAVLPDFVEQSGGPVAGVNVSGLLATSQASERFGLAGDYIETMHQLVVDLLERGARVVFVPHVHSPGSSGESDLVAIERVRARLSATQRALTRVLPPRLDAAELKWCLARMDWVVGARMHATIGSLSSQVPTFGYAYSDKARGVFETCASADTVLDAREVSGREAIAVMLASFEERDLRRAHLATSVPPVVERARGQLLDLLATIETWSSPQDAGSIE